MKCGWSRGNEWQSQNGLKEGGIYFQGMTNDLFGNRVAGMEHGFWSPGSGNGRGFASGKTCNTHQPFGRFEDNVWHDNQRFGIYLDHQYSRDLERDQEAHVVKVANKHLCFFFYLEISDSTRNGKLQCFYETRRKR